ncbi:hypothetical protein AKO1_015107, partial [Acrasis kona]
MRGIWRSDLERIVDLDRDVAMGDLGYLNDRMLFRILTPYKKPAERELNQMEKRYNEVFNGHRVMIEQFFGFLKLKFPMFRCGYRGPIKHLRTLFCLAVAFTNMSIRRGNHTEREKRDAELFEKREQRHYEDEPYQFRGNVENLPEFRRRQRFGRVVTNRNDRQEEDQLWNLAAHRRGDRERYEAAARNVERNNQERQREDYDYSQERFRVLLEHRQQIEDEIQRQF